jgi:hypothetical protein
MPERINSNWRLDSFPTSSASSSRSRVMIWEALATESLGRPVARAGRSQRRGRPVCLPSRTGDHIGSPLQFFCETKPLLVKGTQRTVLMRLRLRASPWTTRTGLRKPGPEPVGSGRFAQYRWPWAITIRRFQVVVLPLLKLLDRDECRSLHKHDSSRRLRRQGRGARRIRSRLLYRPGCVTSSDDGITARITINFIGDRDRCLHTRSITREIMPCKLTPCVRRASLTRFSKGPNPLICQWSNR